MSEEQLSQLLDWVYLRRDENKFIAEHAKDAAKKLAHESRSLAYFDVLNAIKRIQKGEKP